MEKCSESSVTSGGWICETSWAERMQPTTCPDTALPPQAGLSSSLLFHLNPPLINSARPGLLYGRRASSPSHESQKQSYCYQGTKMGKRQSKRPLPATLLWRRLVFLLCFLSA